MQRRDFLKIVGVSTVGVYVPVPTFTPATKATVPSPDKEKDICEQITLVEYYPDGKTPDFSIKLSTHRPMAIGDTIRTPLVEDGWPIIRCYRITSIDGSVYGVEQTGYVG